MKTATVEITRTVNEFEAVGRVTRQFKDGNGNTTGFLLAVGRGRDKDKDETLHILCSRGSKYNIEFREKVKIKGHLIEKSRLNEKGTVMHYNSVVADEVVPAPHMTEEYFGGKKGIFSGSPFAHAYIRGITRYFAIDGEWMRLSLEVDRDRLDREPTHIKISMKKPRPINNIETGTIVEAVCVVTAERKEGSDGKPGVTFTDLTARDIAVIGVPEKEEEPVITL